MRDEGQLWANGMQTIDKTWCSAEQISNEFWIRSKNNGKCEWVRILKQKSTTRHTSQVYSTMCRNIRKKNHPQKRNQNIFRRIDEAPRAGRREDFRPLTKHLSPQKRVLRFHRSLLYTKHASMGACDREQTTQETLSLSLSIPLFKEQLRENLTFCRNSLWIIRSLSPENTNQKRM